jgi:hypothetical protein
MDFYGQEILRDATDKGYALLPLDVRALSLARASGPPYNMPEDWVTTQGFIDPTGGRSLTPKVYQEPSSIFTKQWEGQLGSVTEPLPSRPKVRHHGGPGAAQQATLCTADGPGGGSS